MLAVKLPAHLLLRHFGKAPVPKYAQPEKRRRHLRFARRAGMQHFPPEHRFEYLNLLIGNLSSAEPANKFFSFSRKHTTANNLYPAGFAICRIDFYKHGLKVIIVAEIRNTNLNLFLPNFPEITPVKFPGISNHFNHSLQHGQDTGRVKLIYTSLIFTSE